MIHFVPSRLLCARRRPGIQESGCYWAGVDVLARSNALRWGNLSDRHSSSSIWRSVPRRDWADEIVPSPPLSAPLLDALPSLVWLVHLCRIVIYMLV